MSLRSKPRRGVLLLVVLGLLAMFGMVAVAFVVIAGHERRVAIDAAKIDTNYESGSRAVNDGFLVFINGTSASANGYPTSGIMGQTPLNGIYNARDNVTCTVGAVSSQCGRQLVQLQLNGTSAAFYSSHAAGSVITMLNGPAAGLSSRIVGLGPIAPDPYSTPSSLDGLQVQALAFENGAMPQSGNQCIVSGTPYSGVGLGYNLSTGMNDAADGNGPLAFQPNNPANWDPPGGTNVDYTAADYQSPYLALQVVTTGPNGNPFINTPLPSYHRPELIAFWAKQKNNDPTKWQSLPITLLRSIMHRPIGKGVPKSDNPNFTGSNAGFDPIKGPWDVDNSGGGVPDSVWVDLGLPVRTAPDGRKYKPLYAILCVDLDGRLNLNAHGMLAQANNQFYQPPGQNEAPPIGNLMPALAGVNGTPGNLLAGVRGQGYSPAEINLYPLFSAAGGMPNVTAYNTLLTGLAGQNLNGRYGEVGGSPAPGKAGTVWPRTFNHWWDYSGNYWNFLSTPIGSWGNNYWIDAYGTPPDPQGYGVVASDMAGRPMYYWHGGALQNTPCDLDLGLNAPYAQAYATNGNPPYDAPFGPAELARILCRFDRDTPTLPSRLAVLTSTDGDPRDSVLITNKPTEATTVSSAVPTPSVAAPAPIRGGLPQVSSYYNSSNPDKRAHHFVDLLLAKFAAQSPPVSPATAMKFVPAMLAPEMIAGGKLNLNRPLSPTLPIPQPAAVGTYSNPPLGNWGNNKQSGFQLFNTPSNYWNGGVSGFSYNPTGLPVTHNSSFPDPVSARQLQARYLFILGMMALDNGQLQVFTEQGLTPQQENELTVRRLAQWAINVACFATPDSVMVPFKYNVNPFNSQGWTADNDLTNPYSDQAGNQCNVVWGCKPPELLLMESAAFHNRHVADTAFDSGSKKKRSDVKANSKPQMPADIDLDQPRIPQGSTFFELYCTRGPEMGAAPTDLYTYDVDPNDPNGNKKWMLDLGRMSPAGTYGALPVWRMVVTDSTVTPTVGTASDNNILHRMSKYPDSSSLETEQIKNVVGSNPPSFSLLSTSSNPPNAAPARIDRIVWFTHAAPPASYPDAKYVYFNQLGTSVALPGGQYAMVGSRPVTYVSATAPTANSLGTPGRQSIHLLNATSYSQDVRYISSGGNNDGPISTQGTIKPPLGIVVAGGGQRAPAQGQTYPTGWTHLGQTAPYGIGFSISEPVFSYAYYPEPDATIPPQPGDPGYQWYGDPKEADSTKPFLDHPLEPAQANIGTEKNATDPGPLASRPIVRDNISATQTVINYKTVFLQRLANPSAAFDPINNPYRTVDWMPIDLTVYNGDDKQPTPWPPAAQASNPAWPKQWDPDDPTGGSGVNTRFWSRQRGTLLPDMALTQYYPGHYGQSVLQNLYAQISDPPQKSVPGNPGASPPNFNYDLKNTFGYLNTAFQNAAVPGGPPGLTGPAAHIGDPKTPFPWLTWNGRPFISELELLLVPATSPARLPWEFQCPPPGAPASAGQLYQSAPAAGGSAATVVNYNPFPHLLNFFQSQQPGGGAAMGGGGPVPTNLHRILEYVAVPSRFSSAELQVNPAMAVGNNGAHWFHPPFNRIPLNREPGRINLNTLVNFDVFMGLMNGYPGQASIQAYDKFVRSRTQEPTASSTPRHPDVNSTQREMMQFNGSAPTLFLRPFRSAAGASLGPGGMAPSREVDAGLLRADPDDPTRPLFQSDNSNGSWPAAYDANRNAYFRYQSLQRMANLTTTRSNVFAIWITVGYFEVTPHAAGVDAGHPDGYELGQELGSDTGDIVRHRGFYIFDRSIPMGFQRGVNINSQKGILTQHIIE